MYYCLLRELVYHSNLNYTKFRLAFLEVSSANSPALKKHAAEVMNTVGAAVAGLSDINALIPVLQALGKR